LTLTFAKVSPKVERHYIRGLLDGDGSVHPKIFYFLGTEALIDGVIERIAGHTGVRLKKRRAGRLYRASGYAGSKIVLRWIYQNSKIFLKRKKKIYEERWG
jgi:hypothetical protein